ncbi:hypothetical protein CO049_03405 [Candidatus Roizmanbacteria bacterium CG_4_9_14_0_2_um_filter_36_12]|uniref:Uncharacterized protein n=1 Tax=Candidatus Roizmanbacteria bacterium CG_4_9_14_0_2_um_filter_36_12 TaxID=1974837 RepID=A0A2M8EZ83_9BACT|nr:MAG: hypothetical protein CO049_03405 [Candidatus Roizmanbacteria bacterium CG_4_9_14_0_2_um_filter_36_12]
MRSKPAKDVLEMINSFQKSLNKKPSTEKMHEEIKMMKFKVRPIQGDLSEVNLNNEKFVETLWSLGKLEEFFQKEFYRLSSKNKDLFMRIFNDIYEKYYQDLNKINLQWEKTPRQQRFLEVEIFKEIRNKKFN